MNWGREKLAQDEIPLQALSVVDHAKIQLKLIDFGTARRFDNGLMTTKVCTAHYVAPEVLKRGEVPYTEKVDVWSCGVILYMMLCGFMPFHNENNLELLKLVKKGNYSFMPDRVWKLISDEAKSLVRSMMCVKVNERRSALECLQTEWITKKQDDAEYNSVDEQIVRQMRNFLTNNRLKRVALQIIARQIHDEYVERLRNIFRSIDEDCSGCLTLDEMTEALKELDLSEASKQEMAQILICVDQDQSGTIEWTEFLAATLTKDQYLQDEVCKGAFHLLDVDEDGVLNREDLAAFMATEVERGNSPSGGEAPILGLSTLVEIDQIMKETDVNEDNCISFEEFMALMRDEGPKVSDSAIALKYHRHGKKEEVRVSKDSHAVYDSLGSDDEDDGAKGKTSDDDGEEDEHDDFGDDRPQDRKPSKEHKDPHEGWLVQSQKAWNLKGRSCTLTIYEKKDEGLLEFEAVFLESGEHVTATGSKEDFEQLCTEKEQTGLSGPAATFAAIEELLGPSVGIDSMSIAPPAGAAVGS